MWSYSCHNPTNFRPKGLFGFYDEKVIETPVECERKKVRDIILLMILQVLKVWSENNQIKLKHLIHRISIVSFDCSYFEIYIGNIGNKKNIEFEM